MSSLRGEISLEWADGEYSFALKCKQIEELQFSCGAGFGTIYSRTMSGDWYLKDLSETIRLGLIGGGMEPVNAKRMIEFYVDGVPLAHGGADSPLLVAQAILIAAINGVDKIPKEVPLQTPTS